MPYIYLGQTRWDVLTRTSGLVLASKYYLDEYKFEMFRHMTGHEADSNKGVITVVADIPTVGKLRIGTTHTSGEDRDIEALANQTVLEATQAQRDMPAIMFGDLNKSWKNNPLDPGFSPKPEYKLMRAVFAFPGRGVYAATDAWVDVHGTGNTPHPFTIGMATNKLAQTFSPERDTEPYDRIDYFWIKPGKDWGLTLTSATVPQDLKYTSSTWYGTQKWCCASRPSAVVLGDLLCVVTQNRGNPSILTALLDRRTGMWEHLVPGPITSSSPGIVAYEGKFHLFYRDNGGNAIFHRSSADGKSWSGEENLGFNTGAGVCPVVFGGKLHLFYVDEDARGTGGQVRYRVKEQPGDNWWVTNWSGVGALSINTRKDISAAALDDRLVVVCKDNGTEDASGGVMVATQVLGQGWEWGQFGGMKTSGAPGIVARNGRFELYYRHHDGNAVYTAWSTDGKTWNDRDQNTRHDSMIGGVCPVVFDGKLHAFYPYYNTNKGYGYYQDRLTVHTELLSAEVDLSDHYPLLLEGEMRKHTILCNLTVHLEDVGDALFRDGVWAGTRGQSLRIEGFQIDSRTSGLGFSYMARLTGDTGPDKWVSDGSFAGVRGQSKTMEGFAIKLTGGAAAQYKLTYRAHIQDHGDTGSFDAGAYCGEAGKRVEAMWLKLEKV